MNAQINPVPSLDQEILKVVRLVAAALVGVTVFLYFTDVALWMAHRPPHGIIIRLLEALPLIAGLLLFWKSRAVADYLSNYFD